MIFRALEDRVVQGILIAIVAIVATGTVYYHLVEGWSLLDSVYFCVVSSTTVGFGDPAPQTAAGKLFTIFYLLSSVGLFAAAGTTIVQRSRLWTRIEKRDTQRSRSPDKPGPS